MNKTRKDKLLDPLLITLACCLMMARRLFFLQNGFKVRHALEDFVHNSDIILGECSLEQCTHSSGCIYLVLLGLTIH